MTSSAAQMTVNDFGERLLSEHDLDPVYEMLHGAKLAPNMLKRFCLAYWCFYHSGVAAAIAESEDFYKTMRWADRMRWPRGTERRHFRGKISGKAIAYLASTFPDPTKAVDAVSRLTLAEVRNEAEKWPAFGPWISFKIADMLERVLNVPVLFEPSVLMFYREPKEGAAIVAKQRDDAMTPAEVVTSLMWEFRRFPAPPANDRQVGVQEVETILCKYKSHLNGHYPVGKDKDELRKALRGWGRLAERLEWSVP